MTLRDELAKRVLVGDGAMGTQLFERGLAAGASSEAWCVDRPDVVEAIHHDYLAAGCDLVTTNSFGASRAALERHGLSSRAAELNTAAARLARRATGSLRHGWVLGDIGPIGAFLEPLGDLTPEDATDMFSQQAHALKAGGAEGVIIETMVDPAEIELAVKACRSVGGWPIFATYAFDKGAVDGGFATVMGTSVAQAMGSAIDAGADVVGANCGTQLSMDDYLRLAELMVHYAGKTPVILQPNAGQPQMDNGRLIHPASPQEMAALVPRLVGAGVKVIGGCCGTSPAHLRAMAIAIKS